MSIVSTGSLTITDINDSKQLILYLNPTVRTQIYNPNATGSTAYNPDFTSSNLVITPELYVAGGGSSNLLPSSSIKSLAWYEGTQTTTAITEGSGTDYTIPTGAVTTTLKTLTVKTNFTSKNSQKFTCLVVYNDSDTGFDITLKADVEIVKVTNGVKGVDGTGQNAVVGVLSNENATIPADSTGNATTPSLNSAISTLSIYEGTTDITSSYAIALTLNPSNTGLFNVTTSGSPANRTVMVSTMTSATASASVTFTATRTGYPTITKVFNITKITNGNNGNDATIYWLSIPSTIGVSNTGTYASSNMSIKAFSKTGLGVAQPFNGYIQVDTSTDGNNYTNAVANTTQLSSGAYTYPSSGSFSAGLKTIRVRLYASSGAVTLLDEETAYVISDGNDSFFCNVWCPNGDTIRNSSGLLTIKADLYKGGTTISPTSYKWYAQDPSVTVATNGGGGDSDGGIGWRLLQTIADATTAPTVTNGASGGTITAGTYYVKYTWVSTNGETKPSSETSKAITLGQTLITTVPAFPSGVYKAKVYVGTATGVNKYQGDVLTSGGSFTITAPINTTNPAPPSTNTATYTQNVTNFTTDTITVPASAITSLEGFKAIVTYNTNKFGGVTIVKDISDPILTRIDGVNIFKNGDGQITLKATLLQAGLEVDSLNNSGYTYTWSIYNKDGTKTAFAKTGKTITVDALDINAIGNVLCEVSK